MSVINRSGNLRVMLVDKAGELHQHEGSSSSGVGEKMPPCGYQKSRLVWGKLRMEDVEGVCFQTRQEEYAEFENVPMDPK